MEKKALTLNTETLAAHTASTSNKAIPRHHTSSSEHSGSSRNTSLAGVSHFKRSPLSKKSHKQSTPTRSVDGEPSGRYASPSKQLEELEGLKQSSELDMEEPGGIDPWITKEVTDTLSNATVQLTEAVSEINKTLVELKTERNAQTGVLMGYLEMRARQERESQAEFRNSLVDVIQAFEPRDAAPRTTVTLATEVEGGAGQPPGQVPGLGGSADQPPNPASGARQLSEVESQSESGSSGDNVSHQQVESLANVPALTPLTRGIQGSLSYTHNFLVLTHDRHMFSLGAQVRAPFNERGFERPGFFLLFDTRGAAQTYSPVMTNGKGSGQKIELCCCGYGLQLERGRISPVQGEEYQYHRSFFSLPGFGGRNADTELSLNQFLPSRIHGLDPRIKLQRSGIQPYLLHIENQGFTGGVSVEPLRGSFQLCNTWYIPDVQLLVNFITSLRSNDRKVAPVFNSHSPTQEARDLNVQLLNQEIDKPFQQGIDIGSPLPQLGQNMSVVSILGIALVSVAVSLPLLKVLKNSVIKAVFGRKGSSTMRKEE